MITACHAPAGPADLRHGDRDKPGDRFSPVPAGLTICWAASMSGAWPMWLSQTAAQLELDAVSIADDHDCPG